MFPFKTDLLYEEAGRNPEVYDELLKRLQQARGSCRACLIGFLIVVMAVGILLLAWFERYLISIKNLPPLADLPKDRMIDWISSNHSLLRMVGGWIFLAVAVQFILMLHYDSRIKMLLFLRPKQPDTAATDVDKASMMTKEEFSKSFRTGRGLILVCFFGLMAVWFCVSWAVSGRIVFFSWWLGLSFTLLVTGIFFFAWLFFKKRGVACPSCGDWLGSQQVMLMTGKCPNCRRKIFRDA